MELTESTFSGTSDRVAKEEEDQKQKAAQTPPREEAAEKEQISMPDSFEMPKRHIGPVSKYAADMDPEDEGDTPRRLPAIKGNKETAPALKPPMTPRKNVIPSRRVIFDKNLAPTPKGSPAQPEARVSEHAAEQIEAPSPQYKKQPDAPPAQLELTTKQELAANQLEAQASTQIPAEPDAKGGISAPAANPPTIDASTDNDQTDVDQQTDQERKSALSTGPSTPASPAQTEEAPVNQEVDAPALANLYTEYHDTSAAEEAWHSFEEDALSRQETQPLASAARTPGASESPQRSPDTAPSSEDFSRRAATAAIETRKMATPITPLPPVAKPTRDDTTLPELPTTPLPTFGSVKPLEQKKVPLTRSRALLLLFLCAILLVNASAAGFSRFFGPQGWGSVLSNEGHAGPNLLTQLAQQLQHSPTPGSKSTPTAPTPTQIVNLLMSQMTLDEKLGQMMMVQFLGQSYSPDLDTMISQYHVGSVLYFQFNIGGKSQLTSLNAEMQHNANLPLLVAVDQEGGTVDRLVNLDGPQPSASQIGASNNPDLAYQQGLKDAQDLNSYGFNLNLAPVVDVNNVYNPQLYERTYGHTPPIVSQMAEKYLEGLQKSGKVLGTLKHFPGLGDVSTDPHYGLPALTRDLSSLNSIDWAPYSTLIKQGHVYAVMVTHEIVDALDKTEPSSLSPQVIGILRNQMHFQGVIITDSLTMDSIHNFYTYGDAAAKAVEAGDDILMGADSPATLAQMITGIKQAMSSGAITQQHIDDSVRRILLFKYEMGLLHI